MNPEHPNRPVAVIAGAGPAGLTAALEMLKRSDFLPLVFEAGNQVGGISKTVNYRGNRMDLGGHRFFSKSDWVMRWWQDILPIEGLESKAGAAVAYELSRPASRLDARGFVRGASPDAVMLVRAAIVANFLSPAFLRLSA